MTSFEIPFPDPGKEPDIEFIRQCLHQVELKVASMGSAVCGTGCAGTTCPIVITGGGATPVPAPDPGMALVLSESENYKEKYKDCKNDLDKVRDELEKAEAKIKSIATSTMVEIDKRDKQIKELKEEAVVRAPIPLQLEPIESLKEMVFEPVFVEKEEPVSKEMYDSLKNDYNILKNKCENLEEVAKTKSTVDCSEQEKMIKELESGIKLLHEENEKTLKDLEDQKDQTNNLLVENKQWKDNLEQCKEISELRVSEALEILQKPEEVAEKQIPKLESVVEPETLDIENPPTKTEIETKFKKDSTDTVGAKTAKSNALNIIKWIGDKINAYTPSEADAGTKKELLEQINVQKTNIEGWSDTSKDKVNQFSEITEVIIKAIRDTSNEKVAIKILCNAIPTETVFGLTDLSHPKVTAKLFNVIWKMCPKKE